MDTKKSLVLIVDDIKTNIEFISDIIATIDHIESIGTSTSEETLNLAIENQPDLILLDIAMPKMDGYDVCRQLKMNKLTSDIPVIFLTARVLKEDIIRGFESGAVDYITKPFNLNELISRVNTQLELRSKKKELIEINQRLEQIVEERTKQLVKLNRSLSDSVEKLNTANLKLSTLDRAKNNFIAHINHELRTPLNGIVGYTSLLEDAPLDSESKSYLKAIDILVSRLIKVSENSLLFTELQTIDHNINLTKVNLNDYFENIYNQNEILEKELNVEINGLQASSPILGESRLINACISIIIDNAVKYSPINGKINITAYNNPDSAVIMIQDEGPGFSNLAQSTLFELFTADNLHYKAHGFGIGLATAKHIMELMEGKISIKNNPDKGASVILEFKKYKD